jgi:hypothetical protein
MGHTKDKCWKRRKDGKTSFVLVDDEERTLEQLNRLCGAKHDVFSEAKILKKCLLIEAVERDTTNDQEVMFVGLGRSFIMRFKILTHVIKGKISLSPMEIILTILKELESLKSIVKSAKKKWDEGLK